MTLRYEWIDHHREPQVAPNPAYPDGIDLDLTGPDPDVKSCTTFLRPYPTPRCGAFYVQCDVCGWNALITTAGRPDDPRSIRVPCKLSS